MTGEVPQAERAVSSEAFTTAYWWGCRLRRRFTMQNPHPEAAGIAFRAGDLEVAALAIAGITMFDQLSEIEWKNANLTEVRIRSFEAALARLVDAGLAATQPRPHVSISNDYDPDPLLAEAAQQSGWDAGATIFERHSGSFTKLGYVIAGVADSEELTLICDYPHPEQE